MLAMESNTVEQVFPCSSIFLGSNLQQIAISEKQLGQRSGGSRAMVAMLTKLIDLHPEFKFRTASD